MAVAEKFVSALLGATVISSDCSIMIMCCIIGETKSIIGGVSGNLRIALAIQKS